MHSPSKKTSPTVVPSSRSPPTRGHDSGPRPLSPTPAASNAQDHTDQQRAPEPSTEPVMVPTIKRSSVRKSNLRKKPTPPSITPTSPQPNDSKGTPVSADQPDSASSTIDMIADIKYARKLRARGGRGVDTTTLVSAIGGDGKDDVGDQTGKEKDALGDISKLEAITVGGLSKSGAKEKEGYLSAFTGTNKTLDATKHMERYIEDQLAKRRQALTSTSSTSTDDPSAAPTARVSYDDELYAIPDHLRVDKPQLVEGSVTASAAMLTAIPEIDLGPDSKSRAIAQTERILARGPAADTADVEHDLAFHNNPFPSMRWRISRKTRESLYDMTHGHFQGPGAAAASSSSSSSSAASRSLEQAVADELTRDRRGQRVVGAQGIVTNDEDLRRKFELERRLGEVQGVRDVRTLVVDHNLQQQQQQQQQQRGREREPEVGEGQPDLKRRRVGGELDQVDAKQ